MIYLLIQFAQQMIELLNLKEGDLFYQEIVLLFGKCFNYAQPLIELVDARQNSFRTSIQNNYFKAFLKLDFGRNDLTLKTNNCTLRISVYRLPKNASIDVECKLLNVLYVVCEDDPLNGAFQSDNSRNKLENALNVLDLNIKLIQTLLSELIFKHFNVRKTFALKNDLQSSNGLACEVFYTKLSIQSALSMSSRELFNYLAVEIMQKNCLVASRSKCVALLSFTRYIANTNNEDMFSRVRGFCAMGAEWLAVYGTPCLFTWAEQLNQIDSCFKNSTRIDEKLFMNDSAFRNVYGSCYATTLGSLLHETSHILDLGHDTSGIMWRGFDDLQQFFTINFQECLCYSNHENSNSANIFIEKIVTFKSETENRIKRLKETNISKFAHFKKDLLSENGSKNASLLKQHTLYDLIYCIKLQRPSSSVDHSISDKKCHAQKCECMKSCFYTKSNLRILFYHKWLNSFEEKSGLKSIKLIQIDETEFDIISLEKLVVVELRTIERSLTFDFHDAEQNLEAYESDFSRLLAKRKQGEQYSYNFVLKIDRIKIEYQNLQRFNRAVKLFEKDSNQTSLVHKLGCEIFLMDCDGEILREIFHFI